MCNNLVKHRDSLRQTGEGGRKSTKVGKHGNLGNVMSLQLDEFQRMRIAVCVVSTSVDIHYVMLHSLQ